MLDIHITNDFSVSLTKSDEAGGKTSSFIGLDQLKKILDMATSKDKERDKKNKKPVLESGLLTSMSNHKTIYYSSTLDGTEEIALVLVHDKRNDLRYNNNETIIEDCILPNSLFRFHIKNKKINNVKVGIVFDDFIKETTRIYKFPFGNVLYGGNICWGANHIYNLEIHDLNTLNRAIGIFFNSPFLSHNYSLKTPQGKVLRDLSGAKSIPESMIKEIKTHTLCTVKDFINDLSN